ncbi:hypothetical protein FH581_017100 (plasmid) [Leptospira weilii]|uniref:hypothetical protein n=2 Tax=Leptospira weilii TaxID=28184 RepID=UPI001EF38EF6|nr:hypothetical protein [Leptospira weilii]ULH29046.1 hypothetical protein FH586_03675 [Leptospira weilii]UPY79897.1 hypothetical protein FH581_017905 [Leptospira weilii]UPY80339.1 hypothetical protein FH581_023935 [Leptospira weilii]UPY80364.1 hypothetical protein FH581_024075 [Leptospira weilii]UPY80817.1 hypothetical protein FH581_022355 [Leptospira weilii]
MAYDGKDKLRARILYISGKNPEQIAEILKPDFPKLSANTIRKWAATKDEFDRTWDDYREETNHVINVKAQDQITDMRSKIKANNAMIMDAIFNSVIDKTGKMILQAKDPTNLLSLWRLYAKDQISHEEHDDSSINIREIALTLFQLFMSGTKTKKALKEEWGLHQQNLYKWFAKYSNVKDVNAIIIEEPKGIENSK